MERLAQGEDVLNSINRYQKFDGSLVTLEWNAHSDLDDRIVYSIAHDVTERQQASAEIRSLLEQKETLLTEVHHRIKNNMSLIISLLHLQAEEIVDSEGVAALRDAELRVQAMELLYRKLYAGHDFRSIPASKYLEPLGEEIMAGFPEGGRVLLESTIDSVQLDASILLPMGIVLNELITNAMKYAFDGREDPRLHVTLTRINEGDLLFSVADNGVGMPESTDFTNSSGFGMRLIDALSSQLHATTKIVRESGTREELTIPIP